MSTWKLTPSRIERGSHAIIGPRDDDFVAAITEAIPDHSLRWLRDAQAWLVRDDYVRHAQRVIDRFTPGSTPDPTPLSIEELLEAARGMGQPVDAGSIIEGLEMGVVDTYEEGAAITETVVVERDGVLLVVATVRVS